MELSGPETELRRRESDLPRGETELSRGEMALPCPATGLRGRKRNDPLEYEVSRPEFDSPGR